MDAAGRQAGRRGAPAAVPPGGRLDGAHDDVLLLRGEAAGQGPRWGYYSQHTAAPSLRGQTPGTCTNSGEGWNYSYPEQDKCDVSSSRRRRQ